MTLSNGIPTSKISRRGFLGAGLAVGASSLLPVRAWGQKAVTLTFAVWGNRSEEEAFRKLIDGYMAQHPNVTIKLELNGNQTQLVQRVDTRLAGGQAPDIFRVKYQEVGRYAKAGAIVDLSEHVEKGLAEEFSPTLWKAVMYRDKPYALPHHTDTMAVFCNVDMFQRIGVELPQRLEDSWTWEEFVRIGRLLKEKGGAPYGFSVAWQNNSGYRFLPFLYQHGGRLLDDTLTNPLLGSKEGVETIAWAQSWFTEKLVPPTTTVKSSEPTQNLFANETVGMMVHGDWQIPFLEETMTKAKWQATFMPKDASMAADLGGNCLVVTRDSKNRDVAIDFLKYATNEPNMRDFCSAAGFLPVRQNLMNTDLAFKHRPDAMKIFVEQSRTIPATMAAAVTIPDFGRINTKLGEQLDLSFTSGQEAKKTADNVDVAIRTILGK